MNDSVNIVSALLSQLGSNREAREYLRRFQDAGTQQFAVVKVGGSVLRDDLDALASSLAFLRHVGLFPIVIHGAGPQVDIALRAAQIDTPVVDHIRATPESAMRVIRPVVYAQSQRLVDALEARQVRARMIQHGVFECGYLDADRFGLVGEIEAVHLDGIRAAIAAGALPVLGCLGESTGGQVLHVDANRAAHALVKRIRPLKTVFLNAAGGLLDASGRVISAINLVTDYEALRDAPWLRPDMRLKLEQIKAMLDELPISASVSITSAEHLTRELFTHRGAGTLVRQGETFSRHAPLPPALHAEVTALLEGCFQRPLASDYFAQQDAPELLWSSSHRAAAVMSRVGAYAYMDKFAVTPEAQGEGLGAALFAQVRQAHPTFMWRSRIENPVNGWYHTQSDISWRRGAWRIFAVGTSDLAAVQSTAERIAARPISWADAS